MTHRFSDAPRFFSGPLSDTLSVDLTDDLSVHSGKIPRSMRQSPEAFRVPLSKACPSMTD